MPPPRHVTYSGGRDPFRGLSRARAAVYRGVRDAVEEAVTAVEAQAKLNVTASGKIDLGSLRNSIESRVDDGQGRITGVVTAAAAHARWVEYGRRGVRRDPTGGNPLAAKAAWPPVDVIRAWVVRKIKVLGTTPSGRARRRTAANAAAFEKRADALAFLVGRKIWRDGIKPSPFLGPAFRQHRGVFARRVAHWVSIRLREAGL